MVHPLDGARLKVARAHHHISTIENAVDRFLRTKPYLRVRQFSPEDGHHVFRLKILKQPYPGLSIIIGDAVHNLHSALDHIAYQLARRGKPSDFDPGNIDFPLFLDRDKFRDTFDNRKRLFKDMLGDAWPVIECFQPYNGYHPLADLYELSRWDKHREILFAALAQRGWAVIAQGVWNPISPFREVGPGEFDLVIEELPFGPAKDGDILLRARFTGTPGTEDDEQPDIMFDVAFSQEGPGRGQGVKHVLRQMHDLVAHNIIPAFKPFFV